jgi:hypothetical protein
LNTHLKKEIRLIGVWGDADISEDWVPAKEKP